MFKKFLLILLLAISHNQFCCAMEPDSGYEDEYMASPEGESTVTMPDTDRLAQYFSEFGLAHFAEKTLLIKEMAGRELHPSAIEEAVASAISSYAEAFKYKPENKRVRRLPCLENIKPCINKIMEDQGKRSSMALIDASMSVIRSWEDVSPFAGRVVAYRSASADLTDERPYFVHRKIVDGNPINSDVSLRYGYIEPSGGSLYFDGETGYIMARLMSQGACGGMSVLVGSRIQQGLFIRLATIEEIYQIADAISSGDAIFQTIPTSDVFMILQRELKSISPTWPM